MRSVHYLHDDIAVVGWACRMPGAGSVAELWSLLLEGRCAVTRVPADRFSLDRFAHPNRHERGKSYTWAAGIIEGLWGFDPSVFGISPREAEQIDPQQRILLQLTWEALEDAGIRPSSIAGEDVGVYVGASQSDYGHIFFTDHAIADSHFATGTALAVIANRISYIYNLRGPSITVDTACSSSLVALHQAVEALQVGRIDTAIVCGINLIGSPASFIAFSQASMLSPTGLCQAFSAKADGFVRGEGGAVLVLRKAAHAQSSKNPVHGLILATDVNSDGRTNGISLPSADAQQALLQRVYSRAAIDPDRLSFIEAHGTGTPAGDPIEANALGLSIGRERSHPLPIGSIKTNVGHLEPASGLAGVLKALLALNHGVLPPSLHCSEPNPHIDFERLGLTVCNQLLLLQNQSRSCAGVNSFGFGGTNAHVVVAPGRKPEVAATAVSSNGAGFFTISAETQPALVDLARKYAERVVHLSDEDTATLAGAIVHRRDQLTNRLVVSSSRSQDVAEALNAHVLGHDDPRLATGAAVGVNIPVAFVYSGNGSQWVGMGITAYRRNDRFRAHFELVDSHFKQIGGWSLKEALFSDTLTDRLPYTSVAQPLIFAIQVAATEALRARGFEPATVLGHSVGEVAAAEAAGILDLRSAVKVIHFRSTHQELVRGAGRMAAVLAPEDVVKEWTEAVGDAEIAAVNSPRGVTVAGSADAIAELKRIAESRSVVLVELDLDYPFHTDKMRPIESRLIADLKDIAPRDAEIPFVSTVTGACLPGSRLNSQYWWRNVREPVQFMTAVRAAAKLGARYFVEVGPRGTLHKHISDSLDGEPGGVATATVLDRQGDDTDPFDRVIAKALISGAHVKFDDLFGGDPGPRIELPHYPWQQRTFRIAPTVEARSAENEWHPFLGARESSDALEWRGHVDTALFPYLLDHQLGDQTIFPGAGFIEIGLSAARKALRAESIALANAEILRPLDLSNGEMREVMTRISPGSGTFEIFSRQRLSQAGWQLHCRAKMLHGNAADDVHAPSLPATGKPLASELLYRIADSSGLHYGPAFRIVRAVTIHEPGLISVELAPQGEPSGFLLDPLRVDACFHGFFTVFPELRAEERGVTYVPVRLEEVSLFRPYGVPQRALIEILRKSSRSILANYFIYDAEGEVISVLRGVRCQSYPVRRNGSLDATATLTLPQLIDGRISGKAGVQVGVDAVMAKAAQLIVSDESSSSSPSTMLLEGWATAAGFEIAAGLSDRMSVSPDELIETGRLPQELRSWLINLLTCLEAAELAARNGAVWRLKRDASMPDSASVIKAVAAEHPRRAAELLLAGAITNLLSEIRLNRAILTAPDAIVPKGSRDFYDSTNISASEASDVLARLLCGVGSLWPSEHALRVLQIGFGPIVESLASQYGAKAVDLTIFEPDRRQYERASLALAQNPDVNLLGADHIGKLADYDLIVAVDGLNRLPLELRLSDLRAKLAPRGLLLALEPRPSLFKDIVFGLDPKWFSDSGGDLPSVSLRDAGGWSMALTRAGFDGVEAKAIQCGTEMMTFLLSQVGEEIAAVESIAPLEQRTAVVVDQSDGSELGRRCGALLGAANGIAATLSGLQDFPAVAPDIVVLIPSPHTQVDPVEALTRRCLEIKACAEKIGVAQTVLWLIFNGAVGNSADALHPIESGAWAFSRTLGNEFGNLDVRRIDISPQVPDDVAAERVCDLINSGTAETEIHLGADAIRAMRVNTLRHALERASSPAAPAAILQRRSGVGPRLAWEPAEPARPGADGVEIAVEATGLNFRDLMWMLSLLPDDMLEDGFAGPALGLECAGRVVRVGGAVKHVKSGDRVLAFAGSAFATHVTVPAAMVAKIPETMTFEAAASIPVAFLTASYSLVSLAKLRRGEWILIHGGAGAVGMAAIQIARACGAQIIATAGSPAKRGLLSALGVPHVLDSRSTTFVDEIREITGSGVDVVLNSLAGEAMERSIACLREFGRFVELGKRDYISNTHVGLRPFRKNLSYFGVDVDQLMLGQKRLGARVYADIMRKFGDGTYTALPHSVFAASDVAEAFHLMQQSSHIGKIVVRPPRPGSVRAPAKTLTISDQGTHVVTGGLGGFGLETARWLVDRGARHLVLIGRRGAASAEAKAALGEFKARGVKVVAEPCDISDLQAVQRLFDQIHVAMPPVVGVIHAAMVLDDAIVSNLDAERFRCVLDPKVKGAENLDLVTRGLSLDYFVLFSSVTTLIGNPGQGNYVAANAYMEGLARRRRSKGLPALAIGWGPITDAGVVARNQRLQSGLQKLTGVTGLRAREALYLMQRALELPGDVPDLAVITISPNDGAFNSNRLPVLRSPTYASFISHDHDSSANAAGEIDLRALAQSEGIEAVRRKVMDVIVVQLARVLHSREEDISRIRPLAEIGLDSLMGLELVMHLEECFGLSVAVSGSAGALTIPALAEEIIAQINVDQGREDAVVSTMAERHAETVAPEQLEALKEMMSENAHVAKRLLS